MKEILVISGKGGTGKTSLTACFAQLSSNAVFCDCDVDASNLPLLLAPETQETYSFSAGWEPQLDLQKCTHCGTCRDVCRFHGISWSCEGGPELIPGLCEGCGVCSDHCRSHAIAMRQRLCGGWHQSVTSRGLLFHAELNPGEENSGKLITELRRAARTAAEHQNADWLISDGPPGIGCPVISSMSGADLVLLVTEPTPSGLHDLRRVAKLARQFEIPVQVVINKWDLNPALSEEIAQVCRDECLMELGRIPYDPRFPGLLRDGKTILSIPDSASALEITTIWRKITSI